MVGRKPYKYPAACRYLDQVEKMQWHINQLQIRIMNLRMLLTDTSVHLSDMPRSSSPDLQRHQTVYAQIDEMERDREEAEKELYAIRLEIGSTVARLSDPVSQQVLMLRYLNGKKWKEIAGETGYSIPRVNQFRDIGMEELERILDAE